MLGSKWISPTGNIVCSWLRTLVRCLGFNSSRVCELRLKGQVCESWQCPVLNLWPKGEPLRMFHILSKVDSGFSRLFVFILNSISGS